MGRFAVQLLYQRQQVGELAAAGNTRHFRGLWGSGGWRVGSAVRDGHGYVFRWSFLVFRLYRFY
jgi:hypothetical protein